jgi:menaquinone-dependent protoporphyrinogen oxidase
VKVLVAYATRHGATEGIALRVAQVVGRGGHEVTVKRVELARTVDEFDAFVVGGPAYFFHWDKGATDFVDRHRAVLAQRPVWVFSSGPLGTEKVDAKGQDVLASTRPPEFDAIAKAIQPRDMAIFFGAYDPSSRPIGMMERVSRMMPGIRDALQAGDFRDWPAIEAWAEGIARELAG